MHVDHSDAGRRWTRHKSPRASPSPRRRASARLAERTGRCCTTAGQPGRPAPGRRREQRHHRHPRTGTRPSRRPESDARPHHLGLTSPAGPARGNVPACPPFAPARQPPQLSTPPRERPCPCCEWAAREPFETIGSGVIVGGIRFGKFHGRHRRGLLPHGRCRNDAAFAALAGGQPAAGQQRQDRPAPIEPRRRPATQPCTARRREDRLAGLPTHPRLHRRPPRRRQKRPRSPSLPQALRRPRAVPRIDRRRGG